MERTLQSKERECYTLQNDLKEAKELLESSQLKTEDSQPMISKIDRNLRYSLLSQSEKSEYDEKAEMLNNIQEQLELLNSSKKHVSDVN